MSNHSQKVTKIQNQFRALLEKKIGSPLSLNHSTKHTNTTRSQSYKSGCPQLDLSDLNSIIQIDQEKQIAIVEPRVSMDKLVKATLAYGLIPPVVPEFKEITVGGAIMGGAGESGSHRWGSFNDICLSLEILCGDGNVIHATPTQHASALYGVPCSYGSLGVLLSATIQLIPAKELVRLRYHPCTAEQAIQKLQELMQTSADFLDGIIYSKEKAVIIEGHLVSTADQLPYFGLKAKSAEWYFQHVEKLKHLEEVMTLTDYLFRYDQGAFWVGAFLLRPQLVIRYLLQGIFHLENKKNYNLSPEQIAKLRSPLRPSSFWRTLLHPLLSTKNLWKLFHFADKWAQVHSILQDFCIPQEKAPKFLEEVMEDPGTFPLWLCPIKSTQKPQIFAPHNTATSHVINVGIYGLPSYYTTSTENVTKFLEQKARSFDGKKVLYSRSFYTVEEFWQIYSQDAYRALRKELSAEGAFHEITDKVLSE
ncbi:MAG: FAD-binding oxidoreductase [Verrucomicrobia bacterium]|nr:FAD-binding oxidoreductase [Verrucomicrobiota bacterium]